MKFTEEQRRHIRISDKLNRCREITDAYMEERDADLMYRAEKRLPTVVAQVTDTIQWYCDCGAIDENAVY